MSRLKIDEVLSSLCDDCDRSGTSDFQPLEFNRAEVIPSRSFVLANQVPVEAEQKILLLNWFWIVYMPDLYPY